MKRIKTGVIIIFSVVALYYVISSIIFMMNKPFIDLQLSLPPDDTIDQAPVVIQRVHQEYDNNSSQYSIEHDLQFHKNEQQDFEEYDHPIELSIVAEKQLVPQVQDLIFAQEDELPIIQAEDQDRPIPIITADEIAEEPKVYSFVTMPLSMFQQYDHDNAVLRHQHYIKFDIELQESLDILIGNDVSGFIRNVLQSNNDIVSQQACRSCSLYALFRKVKHHKPLTVSEVTMLQHSIGNLYRFVERMKELSQQTMISPEQYVALQDLNRPQQIKQQIRLQARKASTTAALRKLQQSMSYKK